LRVTGASGSKPTCETTRVTRTPKPKKPAFNTTANARRAIRQDRPIAFRACVERRPHRGSAPGAVGTVRPGSRGDTRTFDSTVRTLAAAGVGATVSLAAALHGLTGPGVAAVALFLASLTCNVVSYVTAQCDMKGRLDALRQAGGGAYPKEVEGTKWTRWTTGLNGAAGLALVAGGAVLAWFISSTA
jgi:hypothetical protein